MESEVRSKLVIRTTIYMKDLKIIVGAVIFLVVCIAGFVFWNMQKEGKADGARHRTIASQVAPPSPSHKPLPFKSVPDPKPAKTPRPLVSDPVRAPILEDLKGRWDQVGSGLKGEALLAKQKEFAAEAIAKLGASDELLKFLDFLGEKGANDLKAWVIKTASGDLFTGEKASAARSWLKTVDDAKLREALCFKAGEKFTGPGLKEFVAASRSRYASQGVWASRTQVYLPRGRYAHAP